MFPSSSPPPHVDPAAASPGSPPPSPPRQPVLPRCWRGPRLRDCHDEVGAGVPATHRAAPHPIGRPQPPASAETLSPPRRPNRDGGRRRGARTRPGARLPAAAPLPTRAGARGRPRGSGGWTATVRTGPVGRARRRLRGRGRPRTRARPGRPPPPLPREPPGPQPSRAALMNGTRRRRPSGGRAARRPLPGHVTPRSAAASRPRDALAASLLGPALAERA